MTPTVECHFPGDLRAAEGHFPGNPIVPGALLLSEALQAIAASLGTTLAPCHVRTAKFFHPARPGDRVLIEYSGLAAEGITFTCKVLEKTVLTGSVVCAARPIPA